MEVGMDFWKVPGKKPDAGRKFLYPSTGPAQKSILAWVEVKTKT